jgi:mono/diheme cytochrome c family protein
MRFFEPVALCLILFLVNVHTSITGAAQPQGSEFAHQFVPGLSAAYAIDGKTFLRSDAAILFSGLTDGENRWKQDARLPSTPFRVRWTARLNIVDAGSYQFHFHGIGRFQLWLDGVERLSVEAKESGWHQSEPIELKYGVVELEAEYESSVEEKAAVGLFWSSNHFKLEPIESGWFTRSVGAETKFDHALGRALSRALRCHACHEFPRDESHLPAPSLTHLDGNLNPQWLISHLTASTAQEDSASQSATRRMPFYTLSPEDARAIAAALMAASKNNQPPENWSDSLAQLHLKRKSKDPPVRTTADTQQGQQSFVSQGCIACHQVGELGQLSEKGSQTNDLFAGGDLSRIGDKLSSDGLARWLTNPASINADHRMPVFDLSLHQKLDIHAWLLNPQSEKTESSESSFFQIPSNEDERKQLLNSGRRLIEASQCGACHQLPETLQSKVVRTKIQGEGPWSKGCFNNTEPGKIAGKPAFKLTDYEIASLCSYLQSTDKNSGASHPDQMLAENNCLSCHRRGIEAGLSKHFIDLSENFPELSSRLAAMNPPSLGGVGDKLHRSAVNKALGTDPERLRDWLDIRMPKFRLSQPQIEMLSDYFISHDRLPENTTWQETKESKVESDQAYWLAAGRLVTSDGFSCQSCHQIADNKPSGIALNAHGTDLTVLGRRVREAWFYRWVRNPARIVPRMEMPAIQSPIHGVLGDSLDAQLQALWLTLNRPDFRPPKPNPVRVIRNYNDGNEPHAHVLTDVIESGAVMVRPLVIGLSNRHNIMIDLASGGMYSWWLGDVARQHTRGKSWYWEPGAEALVRAEVAMESWTIIDDSGEVLSPVAPTGKQFAMELDGMQHTAGGVRWNARVHFSNASGTRQQTLHIEQLLESSSNTLARLQSTMRGLTSAQTLKIESPGTASSIQGSATRGSATRGSGDSKQQTVRFDKGHSFVYISADLAALESDTDSKASGRSSIGFRIQRSEQSSINWQCELSSSVPADSFTRIQVQSKPRSIKKLDCVPGFVATELGLPISEMPISFAWDDSGSGFVGSLKGRVLQLLDNDNDGWEDDYRLISDEIPTPYGLYAGRDGIDVLAKFGLLRLTPSNYGGTLRDWRVIADGWGYTQDYHDWAVGLERDNEGNYFITLPCQQDDRSPAAAHLRGHALKLVKQSEERDERLYKIESIAAGLRFPMGLALNASGDLFSSDNQGNYTPFNELNHLRTGKRYGFINKLENKNGFSPPFESPAINIPHPWMRSVNGICFLDTPSKAGKAGLFGPFEGHLLGCEMNGRCLVRMSLQEVDGQYQGAVYPFSLPVAANKENFEGPIVCEVAPTGDIYVGNLRDSGWGGGNNTGSVVRLTPDGSWPVGIAEVRARAAGLEVVFTQPIDPKLASLKQSYSIRSYIRTPTPAYGGDDQEVKIEEVESVEVDPSSKLVVLKLSKLRQGAVYELNITAIGAGAAPLFPSQAHYTMRAVPQ